MITVWTDKFTVSNPVSVAVDIVKEYQATGSAVVDLMKEGPCADHVGLYRLLDTICDRFSFDPKKITILTSNDEETHSEYQIQIQPRWHLRTFKQFLLKNRITSQDFVEKDLSQNLFACFYNIPSWDRLCILSHVKFNTKNSGILSCNGVLEGNCYNTYELSRVVEYSPDQLESIVKLIKTGPGPLPDHPAPGVLAKPSAESQLGVLSYYNKFFVDLVGETYTHGLTFYPTEKTWRPIYALNPFVISGPQGFLSNLQSRYNIKTFSKWWDESYDSCQNYPRIQRIFGVIDYLDSLTASDRYTMYQEMLPVLQHNQQILKKLS